MANPVLTVLILFGMWLCYEASSGRPLPYPSLLDPLKSVGLFLFRAEWMLRVVFWLAVVAHVWEAAIAAKFALKLTQSQAGGDVAVSRTPFVLFWVVQTGMVGFPSLKLLKEQRREQLQASKTQQGQQGKKAQ